MKKIHAAAFLLTASVIPQSLPALAADSPRIMDEVVVTASRVSESKKEVSANITVVTSEDIRRSAAHNVADLLAEKNIGHIQKYPGDLTSIGIRGFRTDTHGNDLQGHVLILLDGRRAGSGNVAKFLTKNVERIEIVRGPGAVQYGSAGMGGVVNIITRQGSRNSVFIETGAGSSDTYEGSLGGELLQDGFDFAGALTYGTRGDYTTGDSETFHNTGSDYATGMSANLGYTPADNQRIGLIFTRFDVEDSGSPEYFSAIDLDDTSDKSNYSLDLNYNGATISNNYQWMTRFFLGEDENTWHDPVASNPSFWDDGTPSSNTTDQMGGQAQVSGTFGMNTLTTGIDWLSYHVKNSYTPEKTEYDNLALFGLGKTALLQETLIFNYGLRYDWYEVSVSQPSGRDEDRDRLTPLIGLAWNPSDIIKLRAQYAQGFMMPSAQQLSASYTAYGSMVVGNPDLDPEKSSTYEGGFDLQHKGLTGSLTYFHTDFEDKIVTDYLASGATSWTNLGDATIAGFEMELAYDLGVLFDLQWQIKPFFNATFLTQYEDETTGEDLQYTNDTTLSSGLMVDNGNGLFAKVNVTYTSSQDIQDWESGMYPAPVIELDAFTVVDLTASYKFYESDQLGALTVRGELTNLFDEDYAYVQGYPMPGRGFFVSLRWEY